VGHAQPKRAGDPAGFALGQPAEGKAQIVDLRLSCGEQEIALVARHVGGCQKIAMARAVTPCSAVDIMAGGKRLGAKLPGARNEIGELDGLVATDAGHRGCAVEIARDEVVDHRSAETRLEIEHIVGNAELGRDPAGIVNVLSSTAGPLAPDRLAIIIELERDADDIEPRMLEE